MKKYAAVFVGPCVWNALTYAQQRIHATKSRNVGKKSLNVSPPKRHINDTSHTERKHFGRGRKDRVAALTDPKLKWHLNRKKKVHYKTARPKRGNYMYRYRFEGQLDNTPEADRSRSTGNNAEYARRPSIVPKPQNPPAGERTVFCHL